MSHHHPFHIIPWLAALLVSAMGLSPAAGKDKPQIRILCGSSLDEKQAVILATTKDGKRFHRLEKLELRPSMVTDWLPVEAGELHFAVKDGTKVKSIGHFTYPEDSTRGMVMLAADQETKTYHVRFVDPDKAQFVNGTVLALNCTTRDASVFLGPKEEKIAAGQQVVLKPTLESNGMFRLQVSHTDASGKTEACYDRYVPGSKDSLELLFLLPDKQSGIKVVSMPFFSEPK